MEEVENYDELHAAEVNERGILPQLIPCILLHFMSVIVWAEVRLSRRCRRRVYSHSTTKLRTYGVRLWWHGGRTFAPLFENWKINKIDFWEWTKQIEKKIFRKKEVFECFEIATEKE